MVNLQFPHQFNSPSTQPLRDLGHWISWKSADNLIISKCVIFERLHSPPWVDIVCENIVKSILSWEHVHHDLESAALVNGLWLRFVFGLQKLLLQRPSIEYIYFVSQVTEALSSTLLTIMSKAEMNHSFSIRWSSSIHHAASDKIDVGWSSWGSLVKDISPHYILWMQSLPWKLKVTKRLS